MQYNRELVANNLSILRVKNKVKWNEISEKTNIKKERLIELEAQERNITYTELYNLSRFYNITIDDLVFKELE